MQLGSIRLVFMALVLAAAAAMAPDFGSMGRAAAQAARAPATTVPRGGIPPQIAPPAGAPVTGPDQSAAGDTQPFPTRPLLITGRVISDDGSPLGQAVSVSTICYGIERTEAYTDSKGGFSFQFGERNNGVFQDASIPDVPVPSRVSGLGRPTSRPWDLMNCELQARAPGFVSEAIRFSADDSNVGAIIVHRMGKVEGNVVSVASLAAPKDARKAFDKGEDSLGKKKLEEARKSFERAVEIYPEYASAWQQLGEMQLASKQKEKARGSFEAAIKADPVFIAPYLALALVQADAKEWSDLLQTTNRTLQLDPLAYPQAHYLNAVANFNLRNVEAAEKSAREAEKLDEHGRFPGIRRLLAQILVNRREYEQAADQMRSFLEFAPNSPMAGEVRAQLADIERSSADRARDRQ
jgi:tetratricopeptide (TPR) repeat protein